MKRVLEPILMTDSKQVEVYDQTHFKDSSIAYQNFLAPHLENTSQTVLDIGCASGQLTLDLAERFPLCHFLGIDGSQPMIDLAQNNLLNRGIVNVQFEQHYIPTSASHLFEKQIVLCKDFLHHLHQPEHLWKTIEQFKKETPFVVVDLIRPSSIAVAKNMIEEVVSSADPILKEDFYNSLLAAFTVEEVRNQLSNYNFSVQIELLGDRHFAVVGTV